MNNRLVSAFGLSALTAAGAALFLTAQAPTAALAAPMADGAFKVDPVHSTIVYKIKHNEVSWFYGRFNGPTGSFNIDLADPSKSVIDVSVNVENVDTANAGRDKHLKSGDFFSAKEYPTITFKGKSFKKSGEHAVEATGDLTLHGVTKPVTVTIEHTGEKPGKSGQVAGAAATLTIKRSDYGMTGMIGPLGDEVTIMIGLEGGK
jgi:polyisoprenoid-binding protein YceI